MDDATRERLLVVGAEKAAIAEGYWQKWRAGFGSSNLHAAISAAEIAQTAFDMARTGGTPKGRRKAA